MIIGIDPGITGAIAFIDEYKVIVADIPVMAKGKGKSRIKNQVNAAGLSNLIESTVYKEGSTKYAIVYLERVSSMPGQGVASMFSMGDSFGCIRGVCAGMGLRVEIITPKTWKSYYKLGSNKEVCRAKAIELFPLIDLHRKKDHNKAEALLIAEYGKHLEK